MLNERWLIKNRKADYRAMSLKYGVSELVCKLMVNRNILKDGLIKSYINPEYSRLHNFEEMKDLDKAVLILQKKINSKKKIRVVGDYDVDGVISTYILYDALRNCDANVDYDIPDRIKDGYGINKSIIENAKNDNVDTILTCDNGISAIDEINYAKTLGMTVIITDHHDIPFTEDENGMRCSTYPKADAILNPKQEECEYKFKKLCGAGVAFKLIEGLYNKLGKCKTDSYRYIEFLAIATVCDVVDLIDENRIFVKKGLEKINNTENLGLKAIIKENGLEDKKIGTYHLGFVIGPCINAAGRLDTAKKGLKMLLAENEKEATKFAKEILELNDKRKKMTMEGVESAIKIIEGSSIINDKVIVVYIPNIHESLGGIIAGRIREKYNTPTFILCKGEKFVKGSGRSIEEYNMFERLLECDELLEKFGGHPMAAGLSIKEENIEPFRKKLNETSRLKDEDLVKKIRIDSVLPLCNIDFKMIEDLSKLEPFGKSNEKALFGVKNINVIKASILGKNRNVLKLKMKSKENKIYDGIFFGEIEKFEEYIKEKYNMGELSKLYDGQYNDINLDFVFYPSINEYNGNTNIQIIIQNYR